jgi:hypothetical protein
MVLKSTTVILGVKKRRFSNFHIKLSVARAGAGTAIQICGSVEPNPERNNFGCTTLY